MHVLPRAILARFHIKNANTKNKNKKGNYMTTTLTKYQNKTHDIEHFKTLASIASKGGSTGSLENLMNIMLTANDLGISPMKAINGGFYIVKGKISMSTALMADRIRKEGHSIKIPEWTSKSCV